jgi:hypothetical protein
MTKTTLTLAVAIVLSSAVAADAQSYNDGYLAISPQSTGAPPLYSEFPGTTGGGSLGYNENIRKDDW